MKLFVGNDQAPDGWYHAIHYGQATNKLSTKEVKRLIISKYSDGIDTDGLIEWLEWKVYRFDFPVPIITIPITAWDAKKRVSSMYRHHIRRGGEWEDLEIVKTKGQHHQHIKKCSFCGANSVDMDLEEFFDVTEKCTNCQVDLFSKGTWNGTAGDAMWDFMKMHGPREVQLLRQKFLIGRI